MKSVVLSAGFVILFWGQDISAQPPDTAWTQTFGGVSQDYGSCVQQTTDGGYIITGYTGSYGAGSSDIYLVKTNSSGDPLWTQTFGGSSYERGSSVQQTTDGGYIIAGYTESYGAGSCDIYLVKTDSSGDTLWTQTFGGVSQDYGSCVQQTTDGGYIVTGITNSYGAGSSDIYLLRTDSFGDTLWTQTFGGSLFEWGSSVQQTTDGGYIITGYTYSYGAGSCDIYLVKTDSFGNAQWTQTFGDSSFERGYSVQQTTDGGYIVTGETGSYGAASGDIYLIKTDSSGDILWTQTFGGYYCEEGSSVQQTTDGGYIVTGVTNSYGAGGNDVYLIKTDSSGDTLWTQTFGGSAFEWGFSVQQTTDGGYIITGYTESYGAGNSDVYLIKLDPETGIEEENEGNWSLVALESINPNPFSSELRITYSIPEQARVELTIFDLSGRLVEEIISDQFPAGTHTVIWSPSESIPNGCYLIEFNACGRHTVGRCLKLN